MRSVRRGVVGLVLLAGVLVSLPGLADVAELMSPVADCSEPCPGDTSNGKCSSACDECTCCPRALLAVCALSDAPGKPREVETAAASRVVWNPFELAQGLFHPPRA